MKGFALVTATVLAACVPKSTSTGAVDTGERLRVRRHQPRHVYNVQRYDGPEILYDSTGRVSGSRPRFRSERRVQLGPTTIKFTQGDDEIGESDFYRLGGDLDAANEVDSKQRGIWWQNVAGWGLATIGTAAPLAAFAVDNTGAKIALGAGAAVLPTAGIIMILWSLNRNAKRPHLPVSRAERIAGR